LSGALIVVQSRFVAADSSQRLQLDTGSLGNPNDLAFALILSIPCCILIVLRARGAFMRIGGGVLTALLLVSALQTGSRGGLIVLGVVLAFIFFTSPVAIRLIEVGGVVVLIVVSFALAPENVLDRYRVLVSDAAGENGKVSWEAAAAVGSSESRKELLKRSLTLTLQHPLVGVGPGMFPVAVADEHKVTADAGDDGVAWRETHNSYTQISSECGLPALALFLGVLVYALRANFRMVRKFRNHPEFADAHACAYCLLLALVAYAVNAMFMSIGYGFALPMLAAFTACLERASAASMRALSLRHAG
jgi:O-antigen ligase